MCVGGRVAQVKVIIIECVWVYVCVSLMSSSASMNECVFLCEDYYLDAESEDMFEPYLLKRLY